MTTKLTPKEIAQLIKERTPAPPPPAPPPEPPGIHFEPSAEQIEATANAACGGQLWAGRETLIRQHKERVAVCRGVAPAVLAEAIEKAHQAQRLHNELHASLVAAAEAADAVEKLLRQRAQDRVGIDVSKQRLQAAKDLLASPRAHNESGETLVKAQFEAKNLPAEILEIETRIADATAAIKVKAESSGIDLAALKRRMATEAENARTRDQTAAVTHSWVLKGYFAE